YLVREVDIPAPGTWKVNGLPTPVHGTFWILPASAGLEIKGATAFQEDIPTKVPELHLANLLLLNRGRPLEVKTSDGWIICEVLSVPIGKPTTTNEYADNSDNDARSSLGYRAFRALPVASKPERDFVLVKTDKGTMTLPLGDVRGIRSASGALITEAETTRRSSAVRMVTTGAKGKARIVCLTQGLSWAPSYVVDITHPKEAILRSKAVVVNDGEDLQNVKLNLIAGFPNIQFERSVDAFTPTQSLPAFLRGLDNQPGSRRSPVMSQMAITSNFAPFSEEDAMPAGASGGETRQDLFLHPLNDVSLKGGERGYHPLFENRVAYRHVYVWEVGDSIEDPRRWEENSRSSSGQSPAKEEVWHDLKFKNTANVPWSTGPAMTLQEGKILGQDTLYFTAQGSEALLRITRAMDVVAEQKEVEVSRQRETPTPYSGRWDLVTVKGELQVANRKGEPVTLLIKKRLSGELGTCSLQPAVETLAEGLKKVNPQKRLTWEVPVEAKGKLKISYTYKVLVSR
ncbi:MAG: hypothetical protein Q8O00_11025, partial [Holophaga sp.]|nr:hypothetical protein [Holophaga sp.]